MPINPNALLPDSNPEDIFHTVLNLIPNYLINRERAKREIE